MRGACRGGGRRGRAGFTLIEVLLAVGIFAIVLASINTVFYSAVRLRQRTVAALDESLPVNQALAFLRRDLQSALPPGGVLATSFRIGEVGTGLAQGSGLEIFTTRGVLSDNEPWGDVEKVIYELVNPAEGTRIPGKDLMRMVTRNLLSTGDDEFDEQRLLRGVERLEFAGYNGTEWRDTWDTALGDVGAPTAVRVRLLLASERSADPPRRQPLELVVPLDVRGSTNQTQTAGAQP